MRAIMMLGGFKIRNGLRTLFSDPRKLIPFIILVFGIIGSVALANLGLNERNAVGAHASLDGSAFSAGVMIALILLGIGFIDTGLGDGLLAFALCDVDYLFPSPISRRIILAYRLPGLMFGNLFMTGFALFSFRVATGIAHPQLAHTGHTISSQWVAPIALYLSGGIYMNLAMFISITVPDRKIYHKIVMAGTIALCAALGLIAWVRGMPTVEAVVQSPSMKWIFLPSTLGSKTLLAGYAHLPTGPWLLWLLFGYLISLIPMFLSKTNWYEQSIVSTERVSSFRSAARGGYATLMAARASSFKHKGDRPYTFAPFGQGAMALFWAHLCAAGKRPLANFFTPFIGGLGVGTFGALAAIKNHGSGYESDVIAYAGILMVVAYGSLGFMTTAKTASESAIRRRELISPLPIKGWQAVAANLGTPYVSGLLFFFGCAVMYVAFRAPSWPILGFGIGIGLSLRLAARMALQYIIGVVYPDAADKIQQFFAVGIYGLLAMPFIIVEGIVCLPGIYFQSIWMGLIAVTLVQIPFVALFIFVAGKASDRAVATGEPISIWSLLR